MLKLGNNLYNLLNACNESKYTWIYRERDIGKSYLCLGDEVENNLSIQCGVSGEDACFYKNFTIKDIYKLQHYIKKNTKEENIFILKIDEELYQINKVDSKILDNIVDFINKE